MLRHVDDDVEEREDDDVEEEDVEVKDRSKDQEAHFVGDCAVEMQTDISQEPFFAEICMENVGISPRLNTVP